MGISIVILTFNEEENIKNLLPQVIDNIKKVTEDYEIIIVDSPKSTDNTKEVCSKYSVKYYLQEGDYFIDAVKTGIKYASKDLYLCMDADFSHPAEYIPQLYNAFVSNNADIVIGSRYVKDGKTDDYGKNVLYSKLLNLIFEIFYGFWGIKDISGGYKIYKTEILKNIDFMSRYFEMQIEILLKAKLANPKLKVVEVPIYFKKRWKGETKRNYAQFLPSFCKTLIKLFFLRLFYPFQKKK